jgi:hypothetical protein
MTVALFALRRRRCPGSRPCRISTCPSSTGSHARRPPRSRPRRRPPARSPRSTPMKEARRTSHLLAPEVAETLAPVRDLHPLLADAAAGGEHRDHLGHAEQAQRDDGEREAVEQVDLPEGEAEVGRGLCRADHAQKDAEAGRRQPLCQVLADHRGREEQPHEREHEQLGRGEHQHDRPGDGDREEKDHRPDEPADHRGEEAHAQRPRGLPLLGQRMAFDGGRRGGRRARRARAAPR